MGEGGESVGGGVEEKPRPGGGREGRLRERGGREREM